MFTPEQRRIFGPYYNGSVMVFADPLAVYRKLSHALDGDPNKVLQAARSEELETRHQAREKLVPAAREALGMLPFTPETGEGALEEDVFAALSAYLEYMEAKKAKGPTSQTSSQPTPGSVPQSSPMMAAPGPYPMTPMSLYGATSGVPGSSKPGR